MEYSKTVATEYGLVRGIVRDGCELFLGIPFAAPPVGDLAFKHPVPPAPWKGVFDADKAPKNPIQGKGHSNITYVDKDCLYLNVFVPKGLPEDAPVMVWFYGGSYANGGCGNVSAKSDELNYDLVKFAKDTRTVVVSFNYRLNLEGFLNLNFLDKSFDRSNGLYDQMAALKYVRNNINRFGGDADNVTVFGQLISFTIMTDLAHLLFLADRYFKGSRPLARQAQTRSSTLFMMAAPSGISTLSLEQVYMSFLEKFNLSRKDMYTLSLEQVYMSFLERLNFSHA